MAFLRFIVLSSVLSILTCGLAVTSADAADEAMASSIEKAPPGYTQTAPLLKGLGQYQHEIATDQPLAQRYFNQGMVLSFGFNHAEAARSFREAQKLDPDAAMAYWGEALVLGPNINAAMTDENVPQAWAALKKAQQHAANASPRHQAYIEALAARYQPEPVKDRTALDQAYADAMGEVAAAYPNDHDAHALYAEALMDTTPWDYWFEDGTPKPVTRKILKTLEGVLEREPKHVLANHLYIHAVEAKHPQRGVESAERLGGLVPGAGHLVHMPSHIFIRVGRYQEANAANERAIASDQSYVTQCHAQGLYPLAYMPHNRHFLWFGKSMTGERADALKAAMHIRKHVDKQKMREPGYGTLQHFHTLPMWTYLRFGMWQSALNEPKPAEDLKYPIGVWHLVRGTAYAHRGDLEQADHELEALRQLAEDKTLDKVTMWEINTTRAILGVGERVLSAAISEARGDMASAIQQLKQAIQREEALSYDEPAVWAIPNRQLLGAVLLKVGEPAKAEAIYRADLAKYPANGWSLFGLEQALRAQGEGKEADSVKKQFEEAWTAADIRLSSSRFLDPARP